MRYPSRKGLLDRARQWETFHSWEERHTDANLTVEERVAWYLAAYDFVQSLPGRPTDRDLKEKADCIDKIRSRLKHLHRRNPDA
jgi:hypothetical protein